MTPIQRLVAFVAENYGKVRFTMLNVLLGVEHYFSPQEIRIVVRNYERNR